MGEPLKGKCNKCGEEYTTAPVGVVHKCGKCSGGRVVVEGGENVFLNAPNVLTLVPPTSFSFNDPHEIKPTEEVIHDKVEKDIVSWLQTRCNSSETTLDKFTLRYVIRAISDKRYSDRD